MKNQIKLQPEESVESPPSISVQSPEFQSNKNILYGFGAEKTTILSQDETPEIKREEESYRELGSPRLQKSRRFIIGALIAILAVALALFFGLFFGLRSRAGHQEDNGSLSQSTENQLGLGIGAAESQNLAAGVDDSPPLGPDDFPETIELALKDATKTSYQIVKTYKVDDRYFYEGFEFVENSNYQYLYISEGQHGGRSSNLGVLQIDETNSQVSRVTSYPIASTQFGEGITQYPVDNLIYQMTWMDGVIYVYERVTDASTVGPKLRFLRLIPLPQEIGEGWGMTHDDKYLYISNGSTTIFACTATTAELIIVKKIKVFAFGRFPQFNELEMKDNKYIYANNFLTSEIYKIQVSNGKLLKIWRLPELLQTQVDYINSLPQLDYYDWSNNVLNGIAFNSNRDTFLLSGKMWDFIFEVKLLEN